MLIYFIEYFFPGYIDPARMATQITEARRFFFKFSGQLTQECPCQFILVDQTRHTTTKTESSPVL